MIDTSKTMPTKTQINIGWAGWIRGDLTGGAMLLGLQTSFRC